jgi:hypothetical protein
MLARDSCLSVNEPFYEFDKFITLTGEHRGKRREHELLRIGHPTGGAVMRE